MKNIKFIFLFIFSVFEFCSCQQDLLEPEREPAGTRIYASFAQDSKSELGENGTSVLWSPHDSIAVFFGESYGLRFTSMNTKPVSAAVFWYPYPLVFANTEEDSSYIYAVCPFNSEDYVDGSYLHISLPSSYSAVPGTFQSGSYPSVARSKNLNMRFYNVCGGLMFNIFHEHIQKITVESLDSIPLSGDIKVRFDEAGSPVAEPEDGGEKITKVTFLPDSGSFLSGEKYYLPLLPGQVAKGIKITFESLSASADTVLAGPKMIHRSGFVNLGRIDSLLHFNVKVQSVSLDVDSLVLSPGESALLSTAIMPADASDKTLIWSSSDEDVACVDSLGNVMAKDTSAVCKIYVVSNNNPKACDSCVVTVLKHVTAVKVVPDTVKLYVGDTFELTASVTPKGASDTLVIWKSSSDEIATVSEDGLLTAVSKGTCSVVCTSHENESISDTCFVTVAKKVEKVVLSADKLQLACGDTASLSATVLPADAEDTVVLWSSSDTSVIVVTGYGHLVAKAPGNCIVYAKSRMDTTIFASCAIDVIDVVNLSAKGTANCYIIPSPGYFRFRADVGGTGKQLGHPESVSVLWESKSSVDDVKPKCGIIIESVKLWGEYVLIQIPDSFADGNAVVAVRNSDGEILWSWHIWAFRGYDPEETAQVYNNSAGTVMDRNLGSCCITPNDFSSTGMMYQWGRKDPFPPAPWGASLDAITTASWPCAETSTSETGTIDYSIKYPMVFIKKNSTNNDWYYPTGSSEEQKSRWSKDKTDYDPCPYGWKVPVGGWNGLWMTASGSEENPISRAWNNSGMEFSGVFTDSATSCWYGGTGYYNGGTGVFDRITADVYVWSSISPNTGNYAYHFWCSSGKSVYLTYNSGCACGYAVRCVKDE